ncbi:MAG: thioredoxin family protein [Nitriliruptoraceae bacterium]
MPVWQRLVDTTGLDVVSIAVDMQGPDVVKPWTEAAGATFPTFVDTEARLAQDFGLAMVPTVFIVEERKVSIPPLRVDLLRDDNFEAVNAWARGEAADLDLPPMPVADASTHRDKALAWLTVARLAFDEGRRADALESLERAYSLDPDNWLVRKQRWALEAPDKFYGADIDFDWQAEQRASGR